MQAFQEQMHHGMNIAVRDESENEGEEVVDPAEEQEVLNPEEAIEEFEVVRSSEEDITNSLKIYVDDKVSRLDRSNIWLKWKHNIDVSNFSGTLNLEDLID